MSGRPQIKAGCVSRHCLQGQINNALVPRCFEAEREDSKGGFGGRALEEDAKHSRDISVLLLLFIQFNMKSF